MTERPRYTPPSVHTTRVERRVNWVAVQWDDRGPWFVIRRGHEAEAPMVRYTLPHGDSSSSF